MGFLKNLFGGNDKAKKSPVDTKGVYFYIQCDNCKSPVRLRADKTYDLVNNGGGYSWHKTIVDKRCFRPMPTVVELNSEYEVVSAEITGGHYITKAEYDELVAVEEARKAQVQSDSDAGFG